MEVIPALPWKSNSPSVSQTYGTKYKMIGNENSARSFSDRSFFDPPRVMDVRTFGSWMSAPKCLFFQDFKGLTEVFCPPDVRRDIRVDVRGISSPKTYSLGCFFVPEMRGRKGYERGTPRNFLHSLKTILTTPTPKIAKKYGPKICHKMRLRDGPNTTTTILELISRNRVLQFWGAPGCRIKCHDSKVEHKDNKSLVIWYAINCRFMSGKDAWNSQTFFYQTSATTREHLMYCKKWGCL